MNLLNISNLWMLGSISSDRARDSSHDRNSFAIQSHAKKLRADGSPRLRHRTEIVRTPDKAESRETRDPETFLAHISAIYEVTVKVGFVKRSAGADLHSVAHVQHGLR